LFDEINAVAWYVIANKENHSTNSTKKFQMLTIVPGSIPPGFLAMAFTVIYICLSGGNVLMP
jgi:hypothetical protein